MNLSKDGTTIGFIGMGIMGAPMAGQIRRAGYRLNVHNRTRAKAEPLLALGARWFDDAAALAAASDVVITIIGYPRDVEQVYLGDRGLVARARRGSILVDMTTSTPELAQRIAEEAATKGVAALDAPVSGGQRGAINGELTIMVGGDEAAFLTVRPLLALMGANVVRQGPAGAGQHTKAVNQIITSATMMCIAEGLAYARAAGLDPGRVLTSIAKGSAASFHLDNTAPKMIAGDWAPGFFVKHLIKDLEIAAGEAEQAGLKLKGLATALAQYRALAQDGHPDDGAQSIRLIYDD